MIWLINIFVFSLNSYDIILIFCLWFTFTLYELLAPIKYSSLLLEDETKDSKVEASGKG